MLRKPNCLISREAENFISHRAGRGGEGQRARLKRIEAEADLQHQRQQEGNRADAEPEQEAADDAGEEGRQLQQVRDR